MRWRTGTLCIGSVSAPLLDLCNCPSGNGSAWRDFYSKAYPTESCIKWPANSFTPE